MSAILNFKKWKSLYEQTSTLSSSPTITSSTTRVWTTDPESRNIMKIFNSEFLPSILGNADELTFAQYIAKLSAITPEQFTSAIQFFKNKGYVQPNDKIKKFQEDMMDNTDYQTFTTTDDKTKAFNDGVFGRATSSAIVNFMIQKLRRATDQTMKVKDVRIAASSGDKLERAAKVGTTDDVKTGTGTQTLK